MGSNSMSAIQCLYTYRFLTPMYSRDTLLTFKIEVQRCIHQRRCVPYKTSNIGSKIRHYVSFSVFAFKIVSAVLTQRQNTPFSEHAFNKFSAASKYIFKQFQNAHFKSIHGFEVFPAFHNYRFKKSQNVQFVIVFKIFSPDQ